MPKGVEVVVAGRASSTTLEQSLRLVIGQINKGIIRYRQGSDSSILLTPETSPKVDGRSSLYSAFLLDLHINQTAPSQPNE